MDETTRIPPDQVISTSDPGDDVQRRFRYQAAYAALLSLQLLDEDSDFQELFCEHHEDTLIKKKNGKFIGVQVKTRKPGKDPYKSNDEEIISSTLRFIELSKTYPGYFERFVLATNHAFWSEEKINSQNFRYIIGLAKDVNNPPVNNQKTLIKYVKKISSACKAKKIETNAETITETISKIEIDDNLPKFEDVELRLSQLIPVFYPNSRDFRYDSLLNSAKELINTTLQAGALANTSAMQIYFAFCENPKQKLELSVIDGKRITKLHIQDVLSRNMSSMALLQTRNNTIIEGLPKDTNIVDLKMAQGGVSYKNIQLTKDHKYSLEHLLDIWLYKYGSSRANEYFDHLKVVILSECTEVFDNTYKKGELFGQSMLNEIRRRLRDRFERERHLFFDCEYEHLLGMTGILTEMCEVWWSDRFDIESR